MKKKYMKPQLFAESFLLSDAIAGSCVKDVGFSEKNCTTEDPDVVGMTLFTLANLDCQNQWVENGEKGCYDIPVNGQGYFAS